MFSHFILHMSKFAYFIIVYLVQIYIWLLESFLQITVLSFHVLCHKLLNNHSILFGNNFLFVSHIILGVFSFTKSDSFNICNSHYNPFCIMAIVYISDNPC